MKQFNLYGCSFWVFEATSISGVSLDEICGCDDCEETNWCGEDEICDSCIRRCESERQNVLLVISSNGAEKDYDVYYGWEDFPDTERDLIAILDDWAAREPANRSVRCPELGEGPEPWKNYVWSF